MGFNDYKKEDSGNTQGTEPNNDWNMELDETADEAPKRPMMPKGEYSYTITHYKCGWYDGSSKLPACNKATVFFRFEYNGDNIELEKMFFITPKMKYWVAKLWTSCGLRKRGEKINTNWDDLAGCTGRCFVMVDSYKKKDGTDGQSNKIEDFIDFGSPVTQPKQDTSEPF